MELKKNGLLLEGQGVTKYFGGLAERFVQGIPGIGGVYNTVRMTFVVNTAGGTQVTLTAAGGA